MVGVVDNAAASGFPKGAAPPLGEKRRPALKVPRQVLDAFDGLVAPEDKKRTAAAMVVLNHVKQALKNEEGKEIPPGVKYIVQRLVSGLASPRLMAREGYFSALCFLLRLHSSSFAPSFILTLLTNKKSATMKSVTKDEIRDQLLAELLLCGAVIRSGHANQSRELLQYVVNQLCAMRSKKSYLDVTATQFLVNLMEMCEGNKMHDAVLDSLQGELQAPVAELSASQLWMRLVLLRKHHAAPPVWLTSTLTHKNHEALAQIAMKTTELGRIHPVLEELVAALAASSSSSLLMMFWQTIVGFLQGQTSPNKLQILFHLLRVIVLHLKTGAQVREVLTPSVVGLLLKSLTQPQQELREAAKGVTGALLQLVKETQDEESEVQSAVVKALTSPPGSVRFDQLAGHKILALMGPHFTLTTLKTLTTMLLQVVKKDTDAADRTYASYSLGNLLCQPRACNPEAGPWRRQQLTALMKATLLAPTTSEGDNAKDAFFKSLGKQVGHIKEYDAILLSLVDEASKIMGIADTTTTTTTTPTTASLSATAQQQWVKVCSMLTVLKKGEWKEGSEQDIARTVFEVLYCQMALHLFVDEDAATQSINEFVTCHEEVKNLGIFKTEEDKDEEEEMEEDQPNWVEVVTELLLSLMTQEMHLFRSVVQGLFWLLTPLMTVTALTLLTDVLDIEKARQLVKKEDEEDEEEESDDDEDEDDDDDEKEEKGSDDDEKEKEEDSDDDDDDDDNEEEGNDADLFSLKTKMFEASGGIDVDVDMDSVPQEELDRLDERLGALLAEYRGKHPSSSKRKRKRKDGGDNTAQLSTDEKSLMHFQTKVCDMLVVYIKAAPSMALHVSLVNPIFKALRTADLDNRQSDLQNKLAGVIAVLEKKKKFTTQGDITLDTWKDTVNEFFDFACEMPERFVSVIQSCYSQLMHCGRLLLEEEGEKVKQTVDNIFTSTYISHLHTFLTKNHHLPKLQPFSEPCTYSFVGLTRVASTLARLSFEAEVKIHKQIQALRTLQQLCGGREWVAQRSEVEGEAVERDLCNKVIQALNSMQAPMNGLHVSSLLKLLHTLLQVDRRTCPQPRLPWVEVNSALESFRGRISKTALKAFRRDYNVLKEALRMNLNKSKKQGVKGTAEDTNKGSQQQENQVKKKKKRKAEEEEKEANTITNTTSTNEGKAKDKKKNKQKSITEKIAKESTDSQGDEIEVENSEGCTSKRESNEDTPQEIKLNGDDTLEDNHIEESEEKELKKKKKKKKKQALNNTDVNSEESKEDTPQEITLNGDDNLEEREKKEKKKKKKKHELNNTVPNQEEVTSKKKKDKLTDITMEDSQTEASKTGEGKKKKKRKQAQEEEEEEEGKNNVEKEQNTSTSMSATYPSQHSPKKKKKKVLSKTVNSI